MYEGKTPLQVVSAYMQAYLKTSHAKSGINTKEKQVRARLLEKVAPSQLMNMKKQVNWTLFLLFFCMVVLQKQHIMQFQVTLAICDCRFFEIPK
jgi:hypothetical protein